MVTGEKEPDGSEIIFPSSFWQTAGRRIRARNNSVGKFSIFTHTTVPVLPSPRRVSREPALLFLALIPHRPPTLSDASRTFDFFV